MGTVIGVLLIVCFVVAGVRKYQANQKKKGPLLREPDGVNPGGEREDQ
jgi:hypothetical protein